VRGDEARVVTAFAKWLQDRGWTVQAEVAFADILARREAAVLYGEAKAGLKRSAWTWTRSMVNYCVGCRRSRNLMPGSR
jgi:hypothetical protein